MTEQVHYFWASAVGVIGVAWAFAFAVHALAKHGKWWN